MNKLDRIAYKLTRGKWIIISHYMNPKLLLIHKTVKQVEGPALIIDPGKLYESLLGRIDEYPENIIITQEEITGSYVLTVYIEPVRIPWGRSGNIIVTKTPGEGLRTPKNYRKAWIRRVGENYELRIGYETIRFKISSGELIPVKDLNKREEEALELLREAMIEYGELTTRDTVVLLASSMDIPRSEARRILSSLVQKKYLSIRKGYINL